MSMKSLMAAIALTVAVSQPALAQGRVPFRGTYEATESSGGGTFPVFLQLLGGSGEAAHLGRFSIEAQWQVNVLGVPGPTGVGVFTLTAANGDSVFGTATATSIILDGSAYITETCVITGGTGRFAGATGTFVAARVLTLAIQPGIPEDSSASFQGEIELR